MMQFHTPQLCVHIAGYCFNVNSYVTCVYEFVGVHSSSSYKVQVQFPPALATVSVSSANLRLVIFCQQHSRQVVCPPLQYYAVCVEVKTGLEDSTSLSDCSFSLGPFCFAPSVPVYSV